MEGIRGGYMRLNQIRDFVALVESGSMSAAARSVGVSQPSITNSIRLLEAELHVQLVHRTTRGVVPTRCGRLFFSRAKVIKSELRRAIHELGELTGGEAGSVAFGCGPTVAERMVPEALIAFRKLFPNADVHMVEGFGHTLVPKVRDETLEFAIAPRLPEPLLSLTAGIFTRADSPLTPAAAALLRALVATTARFAKR